MGVLTSFLKISLIDDVSKPARTVAQALKDAEAQMKNVNKAMGGSGSSMGSAFKKQLAGFNLTKKELAQVRLEWMRYAQAQRAALGDDWLKKNAAGVKAWKSQTIAALRAVRSERMAERKALNAAVGKGGIGGGSFMEGVGYGAPGALGLYSGMGPKVIAGAAVAGSAAYGMKKAIDYEKAMVEVRKKVNLPEGVGMKTMEDMVDRTSLKFGIAREEVAGLVAQLGAAGVEFKDMQGMMDLTAKGAVAFDVPARDMAQYLAQIRAQTQWSTQELGNFVDKVNMLADTGASSEKDIVDMFSRSAAAAKAANVPLDSSLAALTALNSTGMQPEVSARFWNAFTSKLALIGPDKAKDFKELGLSVKDFQSQFKTDSMGAMINLLEALEKSPNKAGIAQSLFGKEWWDEAARAGQALPEILKNLKNISDANTWKGSSGSALNMQLETSAAQLERLKSLVSQIGDKMMRWTLPPLNAGIDGLIKQMEGFGRIWDDLKNGKKLGPAIMDESNRQLGKEPASKVFDRMRAAAAAEKMKPSFTKDNLSAADSLKAYQSTPIEKKPTKSPQVVPSTVGALKAYGISSPRREAIEPYQMQKAPLAPLRAAPAAMRPPFTKDNLSAADSLKAYQSTPIEKKPTKSPQVVPSTVGSLKAYGISSPRREAIEPYQMQKAPLAPLRAAPAAPQGIGPSQEIKVVPKIGDIPPIPAQEMPVVPKVDASGLASLSSAASSARGSLETLEKPVSVAVDASALDGIAPKASSAHAAVQTISAPVAVHVDASSIDAALAKANALRAALSGIGSMAASAGAAAAGAAARANAAAASIKSAGAAQRSSYVAPSVPGRS